MGKWERQDARHRTQNLMPVSQALYMSHTSWLQGANVCTQHTDITQTEGTRERLGLNTLFDLDDSTGSSSYGFTKNRAKFARVHLADSFYKFIIEVV